jgi:hypothetical protein
MMYGMIQCNGLIWLELIGTFHNANKNTNLSDKLIQKYKIIKGIDKA